MNSFVGVYIHIPFCKSKCNYCDFLSFSDRESLFVPYKDALINEIGNCSVLETSHIETIFFGGGTPSLFPAEFLFEIIEALNKKNILSNAEITVECNPDTIKPGYLSALKSAGFNRLSFGLQSSNNELLKKLGRVHTFEKFDYSYNEAIRSGFDNINIDLMFALPGQDIENWEKTLAYTMSIKPTHISTYGLKIEEGTPFYDNPQIVLPDDELDREMYYLANQILKSNGYIRYEISNFAKPGFESKHNKIYWTYKNYVGLGLGAHSFVDNKRFNNLTTIDEYITVKGNLQLLRQNIVNIDKKEAMSEFMFLGLRMSDGVNARTFKERFRVDLFETYRSQIQKLEKLGLLIYEKNRLYLTDKGVDLSNMVFCEFL